MERTELLDEAEVPIRDGQHQQAGRRIRASQGHPVAVDLWMRPSVPPATLCHGTATRFLDSVLERELDKRGRGWSPDGTPARGRRACAGCCRIR